MVFVNRPVYEDTYEEDMKILTGDVEFSGGDFVVRSQFTFVDALVLAGDVADAQPPLRSRLDAEVLRIVDVDQLHRRHVAGTRMSIEWATASLARSVFGYIRLRRYTISKRVEIGKFSNSKSLAYRIFAEPLNGCFFVVDLALELRRLLLERVGVRQRLLEVVVGFCKNAQRTRVSASKKTEISA